MQTHPEDFPSLLEASRGVGVALTQSSFLSILGYCPRGDRDMWQPQLCHLIEAEPPPAPLRGESGKSPTSLQRAPGLCLLFLV